MAIVDHPGLSTIYGKFTGEDDDFFDIFVGRT